MEKILFCIEYDFNNVSPTLLWNYIASPDGLSSWFADRVETNGKLFTFYWNEEKRCATQISQRAGISIKFRWCDETSKKYHFELKLIQNELTKNTTLVITDFATKNEVKDYIDLWDEQITILQKRLGA